MQLHITDIRGVHRSDRSPIAKPPTAMQPSAAPRWLQLHRHRGSSRPGVMGNLISHRLCALRSKCNHATPPAAIALRRSCATILSRRIREIREKKPAAGNGGCAARQGFLSSSAPLPIADRVRTLKYKFALNDFPVNIRLRFLFSGRLMFTLCFVISEQLLAANKYI